MRTLARASQTTGSYLQGSISSNPPQWEEAEGTHGRINSPRLSSRAHRAEHGARDLHRPVLCGRAHPHLVWSQLLPDEAKSITVGFPQGLNNARGERAQRMRIGTGGRRHASRSPPDISCPASKSPTISCARTSCCAGVVASCAIAPSGGLSVTSSGARLSGVQFVCA